MRAGAMKYRLLLMQPKASTNDFGEEATTYEPLAVIWAERVKQSGSRSNEVGEHFPDYRAEFNITLE